ncbi:NAD(P)-binding protein [Melanomma pulvis-pyrius CBS 109.77]|uniref:NAD(P)-binding protein n=1 Tax=Melanomma pulvis-pyrius CBS 109.77 TaxID=1314802 RepID=A0A6A6X1L0_9PLEO|nr:NAD(P)-binding protein [Melanomma pulvis-pyrius CBS 109.77]
MAAFDPNMFTTPFQLTKSLHRDVYEAIDPANPTLKATGKVVLVTGAAGGLGSAIAKAWSSAEARGIILVGRDNNKLEVIAATLDIPTLIASGSIADEVDVKSIFTESVEKFGTVDVVINTAGGMDPNSLIGEVEPAKWWDDFEVHVKGTYNLIHHLIKTTSGKGTFINLVSLSATLLAPGLSSYSSAKIAAIKLGEYIDLEQPNIRTFSVHPGIVEAEGGRGAVVDNFTPFAKDKQALTAGLTLYLQKPKADFLRGGFISTNWDVEEMEKHKDEIVEGKLLKLAFLGAKLGAEGHPWKN